MKRIGIWAIVWCIVMVFSAMNECFSQSESTAETTKNESTEMIVGERNVRTGEMTQVKVQAPEYKGGLDALYDFLGENLKYPEALKSIKAEGICTVEFLVGSDGIVAEARVMKSSGYPEMDDEAVRVVMSFPAWHPATKNGEAYAMKTLLPISFKYYGEDEK